MKSALTLTLLLLPSLVWSYIPPSERILQQWAAASKGLPNIAGTLQHGAVTISFHTGNLRDSIVVFEANQPTTDATALLAFTLLLGPARTHVHLQALGVDLAKTGLARNGDRIAWVIGATGEGEATPQIWIDRQWRLPVRLLLGDVRVDFGEYAVVAGRPLPKEITITRATDRRIYRIEAAR